MGGGGEIARQDAEATLREKKWVAGGGAPAVVAGGFNHNPSDGFHG